MLIIADIEFTIFPALDPDFEFRTGETFTKRKKIIYLWVGRCNYFYFPYQSYRHN